MNVQILSSFEDAKHVWNKFEVDGSYYGFQSFHWLYHWYQTIGQFKKHELCFIYGGSDNDTPLIFLPLIVEYKGFIRCLTWQGDILSDYQAPLLNPAFSQIVTEDEFILFWRNALKIMPKFDVISFHKIPEMVGKQRNPFMFLCLSSNLDSSYSAVMSQSDNWEHYYSTHIKKSIRLDSRRQRKRLSEMGQLEFIIAKDAIDIKNITENMIKQKKRRYRETGANDIFREKKYRDFYLQSALSLVPLGLLHVSALKLDDKILATHWGVVMGKTFYYLMPTYEGGEWKKYSCGRLLLEYLLEWSYNQRLEYFDFSGGGEDYKKDWCNREMKLYEFIMPLNRIGQLYASMQQVKKFLKNNPRVLQVLKNTRNRVYDILR